MIVPLSVDWTSLGTGGGIETFLTSFFRFAPGFGLDVTVLCPGPREATLGSIHYVPIMEKATTDLAYTLRLRRVLARGSVAIPPEAVVLANKEHFAWAFRGVGLPVVLMSHGAIPERLQMTHGPLFVGAYHHFIERHAVMHAESIVVTNAGLRDYYVTRYPRLPGGSVRVIPVGIDLLGLGGRPRRDPFRDLDLRAGAGVLLFVGRLYPEKDPLLFISACDRLRGLGQVFEAVMIGNGTEADEVQKAAATRSWLHWIPRMSHSDVLDAISEAEALVITSRYEAGPLVLLEALGLGTPVVSTRVGRASELISDANGQIVDANPEAVAAAIRTLSSRFRQRLREANEGTRMRIDVRNTIESLVDVLVAAGRHPAQSA